MVDNQQLQSLADFIRDNLDKTGLGAEEQAQIEEQVHVLAEQIRSGSPKLGIVSGALSFIKGTLEKASGSVVASGILYQIDKFAHAMQHLS